MRILHVAPICGSGGVETVLATLIRRQIDSGMDVEAFFLADLGGSNNYSGLCKVWNGEQHSLTEVCLRRQYDVVHVVTVSAVSAVTCLRHALYDGAIIFTCHGVGGYDGTRGCDFLTAVSAAAARSIQPRSPDKVQVVYNGVDIQRFHPASDRVSSGDPVVAWIGRSVDPDKDADLLIAAAPSLVEKGFRLVVIDGSPTDTGIRGRLPAGTDVILRKPWQEMGDFYRSTAVSGGFLLSTSNIEACPMNLLEAQACGCPVIAPDVGGVPEVVIHEKTGYVFAKNSGLSGMTEGVDWMTSGDNRAAASAAGPAFIADQHSAERMCQDYARLYALAVERHARSSFYRIVRPLVHASFSGLAKFKTARRCPNGDAGGNSQ